MDCVLYLGKRLSVSLSKLYQLVTDKMTLTAKTSLKSII